MNDEIMMDDHKGVLERLMIENDRLDRKINHLHYVYQNIGKMLAYTKAEDIIEQILCNYEELTGATCIALYMRNPISEKCELAGYKNKKGKRKPPTMPLTCAADGLEKVVAPCLDLENEEQRTQFEQCFIEGKSLLEKLKPRYVFIFRVGGRSSGFVAVDGLDPEISFEQGVLDAAGTLASLSAVVSNLAQERREADLKTENLGRRLGKILKLNEVVKTINSVKSIDSVMALLMGALDVTYGVNLGFIALYNKESMSLEIETRIGMQGNLREIPLRGALLPLLLGEKVITYEARRAEILFEKKLIADFTETMTGACILPIFLEEYETRLIGAIAIMGMENGVLVSDENVMLFEVLANHVAPIIDHIQRVDSIKKEYHPDYAAAFMDALRVNIDEAELFALDLYVIWINRVLPMTFKPWKMTTAFTMPNVFKIDKQNLLIITSDKDDVDMLTNELKPDEQLKCFKFRKDFDSVQDFEKLFE